MDECNQLLKLLSVLPLPFLSLSSLIQSVEQVSLGLSLVLAGVPVRGFLHKFMIYGQPKYVVRGLEY